MPLILCIAQADLLLNEEEILAHNPAHSAVPRLHCLVAKTLDNKEQTAIAARNMQKESPGGKMHPFNFQLCPGLSHTLAGRHCLPLMPHCLNCLFMSWPGVVLFFCARKHAFYASHKFSAIEACCCGIFVEASAGRFPRSRVCVVALAIKGKLLGIAQIWLDIPIEYTCAVAIFEKGAQLARDFHGRR